MSRSFLRCATLAVSASLCALPFAAEAAAPHHRAGQAAPSANSTSLDGEWQLYRMPDFAAWPATARLSADQIAQLKVPGAGKGWEPIHLPDDYVVRGEIAREPNPSLLASGAVCGLGARECEVPNGRPSDGKAGALNRQGRDPHAGHGYLPLYPAWYLRTVTIPATDEGKKVWLDFGGVYRDAVVFVNGRFIDQHASGYSGFRLDITSAVHCGEKNTVAVFVDPRWLEGWWYEGGGIYRHVQLIVADKLHVSPWGTFVNATVEGPIRSAGVNGDRAAAHLAIDTTVHNEDAANRGFTLTSQVIDPAGKVVGSTAESEVLSPAQENTFHQQVEVSDASLWSLEHRSRYRLKTTLRAGQRVIEEKVTPFGIRKIEFDPDKGFLLNGRHVMLDGMCVHQDFPGVGIAAPDNLWRWRIAKLQAMGTNAYRTAHNPLPDEFYDAADDMGMLVMDETRHLGESYYPKTEAGTPYADLSDVTGMVLQHRNHPSVIMWSLANEEGQQSKAYGAKVFAATREAIRKIDPSRPTTSAMNGGFTKEGFISVEDILGMNYHSTEFAKIHEQYPRQMIYGSEDINAKTSRGTLESSQSSGLCSEYGCGDNLARGPWDSWVPVVENPFVAGQFVWTGFDYRGEPNPFSWPAATSQTGAMDLAGFPKPVYFYWKAAWTSDPLVYISPDWNLPASAQGQKISVRAFSNCDQVELVLNGKSLGKLDMPRNKYLDWQVPYAPGTLTAVGYREGRAVARYSIGNTGPAATMKLDVQVAHLAANAEDVAPIGVTLLDAQGHTVSNADREIAFTVSGTGTLAGVANGNPVTHELNSGSRCETFRGLCMVLVKAGDHAGAITVEARADGLKPVRVVVPIAAVKRESY